MKNVILAIAICFILSTLTPRLTEAQVRFVNLSNSDVFIAQAKSIDAHGSDRPGNTSGLAYWVYAHWIFSGWHKLPAGTAVELPKGYYYIELDGQPITYNNRRSLRGLVKNSPFRVEVVKDDFPKNLERELKNGFRQISYFEYDSGTFNVFRGSPAYEVVSDSYSFSFSASSHRQTQAFNTRRPVAWVELKPNVRDGVSNLGIQTNGRQFTLSAMVQEGYDGGENGRPVQPGTFFGNVVAYSTVKLPLREVNVSDAPIPKINK